MTELHTVYFSDSVSIVDSIWTQQIKPETPDAVWFYVVTDSMYEEKIVDFMFKLTSISTLE